MSGGSGGSGSGMINTTGGTDSGVETENENSTDFSSNPLTIGDNDNDDVNDQESPGQGPSTSSIQCASTLISRKISLDVENPLPPAPPTSPDVHSSNFFHNSSNSNSCSSDMFNNLNPSVNINNDSLNLNDSSYQSQSQGQDLRLLFPLNQSGSSFGSGSGTKNREIIINIDPSPSSGMCEDDDDMIGVGDSEDNDDENTADMEQNHNTKYSQSQLCQETIIASMEDALNHGHFGTAVDRTISTLNNPCRTVIRFSSPQFLPKMSIQYSFEPPPGLKEFMSIQPHSSSRAGNGNSGGYTAVFTTNSSAAGNYGSGSEDSSPSSSSGSYPLTEQCTALVPYENRELQRKTRSLYSTSWRRSATITSTNSEISHSADNHHHHHHRPRYDSYTSILKEHGERRLRLLITSSGPTQTIVKLLSTGVNPNASDSLGRTPLHLASAKGQVEVVRLLLSYGANPNLKDSLGNTPLHLASCTSHFDVVTTLLRAGTDVSTLDNHGRNPLQLAQSKLRLLTNSSKNTDCNSPNKTTSDSSDNNTLLKTKLQIQQIIEMMGEYLGKKGQDEEAELLNAFANRFSISSHTNREHLDQDVKDLLSKINCMSLDMTGSGNAAAAQANSPQQQPQQSFLPVHHNNATSTAGSPTLMILRPARPFGTSSANPVTSFSASGSPNHSQNPSPNANEQRNISS